MTEKYIPQSAYPHNIQILFFKRFDCLVPSISLRSVSEIRNRGVYAINEDEDETMQAHNEDVETSLTINKLFSIWSNGYRPKILKADDCVEIFNAITSHLQQWVGYLNHGIQVPDAPFEELIQLDRFADVVYEHARYERKKRSLSYIEDLFKNNDLGFNLNPMQQFGQNLTYIPLGQGDSQHMFYNQESYHKEERIGFTDELSRLGGKMSQGVREMERASIFNEVNFDKK